ncbi:hypothetical protein FSST1_012751 [Fusarium sambucinum]
MSTIYQSAIITIAADSSPDANAGLHNSKSTSMLGLEDTIKICNKLSTGEESSVYLFPDQKTRIDESITNLQDMGDLLSHRSLRERGWTLQERILSPRIIHYESEDELLWMGHNLTIPKVAHRVKSAEDAEQKGKQLKELLRYWTSSSPSAVLPEPSTASNRWATCQDSIIDYGSYSLVGMDDHKIVAEPITWQASAPDGTFFGRCTNAYIHIKAKFARGMVFPNCGHDFSDYHQVGIGGGYTVDPPKERCAFLILEGGKTSDLVWLDESRATQDPVREGIDVKVVILTDIRPEGEEPYLGACLICTLDERYHLTRVRFTESVKPWKEGLGIEAPLVTGPKLCDKKAMELIII